jgi:WD40 repeat protein
VRVLSAHKKPINCVTFSPDGTQLAEAAHGGIVRLWDVASGAVAQELKVRGKFPNQVRLEFAPDGKRLAATNGDIVFIDLEDDGRHRVKSGQRPFAGGAFSPDGQRVFGFGQRIGWYDANTGLLLTKVELPKPTLPMIVAVNWPACAFDRNGTRIAIARRDGTRAGNSWIYADQVFVCDPETDAVAARFEWTGHSGNRLAFSPDGKLVAAACGPVLRVWDVSAKELVAEKRVGKSHFLGMAFSPDGRYIATVSKDSATRFWPVGEWGEPKTFEWKVGALLDVAFAPDGTTAAVSSDKGQIVLFDVD